MSSKLTDTEPGGESTQYESIQTVTKPHAGQDQEQRMADVEALKEQEMKEHGERVMKNVMYGQNISESGVGGKTVGMDGVGRQEGGYGGVDALRGKNSNDDADAKKIRREQGYGDGSGVGG